MMVLRAGLLLGFLSYKAALLLKVVEEVSPKVCNV